MRLYEVSTLLKSWDQDSWVTMCEDCLEWFKDKKRTTDGKSFVSCWKLTSLPSDGKHCGVCGRTEE